MECAFYELERDAAVQVVILTGAGTKAFVAGADIKEMAELTACQGRAFAQQGQQALLALAKMTKPVIAAVNGFALGGGLELALACDFIYASDKARFGFPEVTLGVIPGFGGTQNLPRLIGKSRANELIFTGKMIDAQKAWSWGIVNEVCPAEELLADGPRDCQRHHQGRAAGRRLRQGRHRQRSEYGQGGRLPLRSLPLRRPLRQCRSEGRDGGVYRQAPGHLFRKITSHRGPLPCVPGGHHEFRTLPGS